MFHSFLNYWSHLLSLECYQFLEIPECKIKTNSTGPTQANYVAGLVYKVKYSLPEAGRKPTTQLAADRTDILRKDKGIQKNCKKVEAKKGEHMDLQRGGSCSM